MLAIATQNPDSIPETYVRQHIRLIAPGKTVVLYFEGEGILIPGVRSFHIMRKGLLPWTSKLFSIWNVLVNGYSGAITGKEEKRVIRFLRDNGVTSILAEFGPTGCALRRLCKKAGIKLIVNFHGYDATVMPKRILIRWAYHKLARDADYFICGSKHFAGRLEKLGFSRNKIRVIPCGIEVDKFAIGGKKDPNLIVAVGRLTEKKAPHLTIEAFSIVHKALPEARLEMIGDGPLRQLCEQKISEHSLEGCVILHGAKEHEFVKQKLSGASVFVQHSVTADNGDTESQGISLLEAMISSVPVVTTKHNGFPETVVDGETGYLVEEREIKEMAKHIIHLLKDAELRMRMGRQGRSRVIKNYSANDMAKKLCNVIMPKEVW